MNEQEMTILEILDRNHREMSGLEIVKQSQGELKRGTVYIWLQQLEDKLLITSRAEEKVDPMIQIPRLLYRITESGVRALLDAQTNNGGGYLVPSIA